MTNNIQENFHKVNSWFLSRKSTSQKGVAWYIESDERGEPTTKITLHSEDLIQIQQRNQKLYRQAKAKRIQHRQTGSTTNAKGTSLSGKYKRRKGPTKTKPKHLENGNRNIHIDNYLKCKWIKCSNQKTQARWMDTNTRHIYMLSTRDPLQT